MSLDYTHKPNYFMFAQLFIRHLQNYFEKHPDAQNAIFDLRDIYELFRQDLAATTTNLEGILNIADEYQVETLTGDQKLISNYQINSEQSQLQLELNSAAVDALIQGKALISPDATLHQ